MESPLAYNLNHIPATVKNSFVHMLFLGHNHYAVHTFVAISLPQATPLSILQFSTGHSSMLNIWMQNEPVKTDGRIQKYSLYL